MTAERATANPATPVRCGSPQAWAVATRPRSLPVAISPVLVGATLGFERTGAIDRTVLFNSLLSVVRNRATWPAILVNTGLCGAFFTFAGLWTVPYLMQVHDMPRPVAASQYSDRSGQDPVDGRGNDRSDRARTDDEY